MIFPAIIAIGAAIQMAQAPTMYVPAKPQPDTVLAKVNGVPIRAGDIDKVLWDWMDYEVTEDLIVFQIVHDLAVKANVSVSADEIEKVLGPQLEQIKKQVPQGQDLDSALRSKGFPKSRLFMRVQIDLLATKVLEKDFKASDYISASTLLVKPKSASQADKEEAVGRAKDIYNRLKKGEDWDKVLASTGQDPNIVKTHGALGWHAISLFPKNTQAELVTLKAHDVTTPAETPNGLQIFRVDMLGATADAAVLAQCKDDYARRNKEGFFKDLESKAKVERLIGGPKIAVVPQHVSEAPRVTQLEIKDTVVGTGVVVEAGDEVTVRYRGTLMNGTEFDSNMTPGKDPFKFTVGAGMVIKGWDQGLLGMKVGGKRSLKIPSSLAYGARAIGPIPAGSDLAFDIELLTVTKKK